MPERLELVCESIARVDDISQRRSIFPLQSLDERQAIFNLLQLRRRRIDSLAIQSQAHRQILELRLNRVARLQMRPEHGIDIGKLGHPFPDDA
jgi:hypothetical protein